ncbi:MAG: LemA family protein [Terriglobia bacterium]
METPVAIVVIAIIVVLVSISVYLSRMARNLKRLQNNLDRDWIDIDKLLQQRSNQLPRIIQICRSYLPDEKAALKAVSEARSAYRKAATVQDKASADAGVTQALHQLFAEAKNSPPLESNNTFVQLQTDLMEIEETLAERRDLFNEDVQQFNSRLQRIPGKWMRGRAHVRPRPLFEAKK